VTSVTGYYESETIKEELTDAYNIGFEINETELVTPEPELIPDEKLEILNIEYDYKLKYEMEYINNKKDAYNADLSI
jgi:hypothetical protein